MEDAERFSKREKLIIEVIGRKKLTLEKIKSDVFKKGEGPFDSNQTISNSVGRIIRKCLHYNLDWTLTKSRENNKLFIKKGKRL